MFVLYLFCFILCFVHLNANICDGKEISSCGDIADTNCGWCPSLNVAKPGSSAGPSDGYCPATTEAGQWTWMSKNCKCLKATSCDQLGGTDCGWCPSLSHAYLGGSGGPSGGINCEATAEAGQWTWYQKNCKCLNATSCDQLDGTDCGWCPSLSHAYLGSSTGPSSNITCEATAEAGQWTWYQKNCKCLNATSCGQLDGTDCGWCPSRAHAYLGSSSGPNNKITCEATPEAGQWTWYQKNCKCLNATSCGQLEGTDCGWCPSLSHAYLGGSGGPSGGINCEATAEAGQWTWYQKNCKCLSCSSCSDISGTDCGWCGANGHCYLGSSSGPSGGISCPVDWVWSTSSCKQSAFLLLGQLWEGCITVIDFVLLLDFVMLWVCCCWKVSVTCCAVPMKRIGERGTV